MAIKKWQVDKIIKWMTCPLDEYRVLVKEDTVEGWDYAECSAEEWEEAEARTKVWVRARGVHWYG